MSEETIKGTPLLDAEEAQLELLRKKVGCRFNQEGVICGLWENNPARCERCSWNLNKGKEQTAP